MSKNALALMDLNQKFYHKDSTLDIDELMAVKKAHSEGFIF
jgi:hypothetical protein